MMGTRLWYGFYGDTLSNTIKFESKVGELCREIGPPIRAAAAVPSHVPLPATVTATATVTLTAMVTITIIMMVTITITADGQDNGN